MKQNFKFCLSFLTLLWWIIEKRRHADSLLLKEFQLIFHNKEPGLFKLLICCPKLVKFSLWWTQEKLNGIWNKIQCCFRLYNTELENFRSTLFSSYVNCFQTCARFFFLFENPVALVVWVPLCFLFVLFLDDAWSVCILLLVLGLTNLTAAFILHVPFAR